MTWHWRQLWGDVEVTRLFGGPFSDDEVRVRFERELERIRRPIDAKRNEKAPEILGGLLPLR